MFTHILRRFSALFVVLFTLFLTFFPFFSTPAFAQEVSVLPLVRPNVDLSNPPRPVSYRDYIVVAHTNSTTCPTEFAPKDGVLVMPLAEVVKQLDEGKKPSLQLPLGFNAIGTYMQVDRDHWVLTSASACRVVDVSVSGVEQIPYAAYINRLPKLENYYGTITVNLPETSVSYFLMKTQAESCPVESTGDGKIYLNQTVYPLDVSGGNWSVGVYREETILIPDPKDRRVKQEGLIYKLVKETCQAFFIANFNASFSYTTTLPPQALAGYVPPVRPPVQVSGTLAPLIPIGPNDFGTGVGVMATVSVEVRPHLSAMLPLLVGGASNPGRPTIGFGGGVSGGGSYRRLTVNGGVALMAGSSPFQLGCNLNQTATAANVEFTCGATGQFPLVVSGAWMGPLLTGSVDIKVYNRFRIGLSFTAVGQWYDPAWPKWRTLEGRELQVTVEGDTYTAPYTGTGAVFGGYLLPGLYLAW